MMKTYDLFDDSMNHLGTYTATTAAEAIAQHKRDYPNETVCRAREAK